MTDKTVHTYDDLTVTDAVPDAVRTPRKGKLQALIETLEVGQGIKFDAAVYNESTPRAAATAFNKKSDDDGPKVGVYQVAGGWFLHRKQ